MDYSEIELAKAAREYPVAVDALHGYFYIPQGEKCPMQAAKDWIA